tara:strand:- start:20556 stop:21194 length:639 start_codon:yes stop_codon:yes gene_type:complete
MNWSEYQEQAAKFFLGLGLSASIEQNVKGARGAHDIDVYVTGSYNGINFNWVVECKAWKNNIPKEKVMALAAIVQDVGADRGFLLSEVGFQSGAILASRSSNITLTSLSDLSFSTEKFAIDTLIGRKNWEIQKSKQRLMRLKRAQNSKYNSYRLKLVGELCVIESMFQDALEADFPILYPVKKLEFSTLEKLLVYADEIIEDVNKYTGECMS